MDFIELDARAKINLSLDVTGKRSDGYHEVKMIMQTLELCDRVRIYKAESGIRVETDSAEVPEGPRNIAFRAAELFLHTSGEAGGVKIIIKKHIPVAAGLAGGSTDAAAVLKGMNILFKCGMSADKLRIMGKSLGADVPFCIDGGTVLAEGIGEVLTPLRPLTGMHIVLIRPRLSVSTAWVYGRFDEIETVQRPDTELLINAVNGREIGVLTANMKNVLEEVTVPQHTEIAEIKDKLLGLGASGSMMSGSGPTVFGVFAEQKTAAEAYEKMHGFNRWDCFITKTA